MDYKCIFRKTLCIKIEKRVKMCFIAIPCIEVLKQENYNLCNLNMCSGRLHASLWGKKYYILYVFRLEKYK